LDDGPISPSHGACFFDPAGDDLHPMAKIALTLALLIGRASAADPKPHPLYYVLVRTVTDPSGAQGPITDEVRALFVERLERRPDVLLEPPEWLPVDGPAMKAQLLRHGMRAYEAHVKIVALHQTVSPGPSGERRLAVEMRLRLFGNTLPERELKIGGDGEAQSSARVGPSADLPAVQRRLRVEVTRAALDEAIVATVRKIELVAERERNP
jgi:hypothetical protein